MRAFAEKLVYSVPTELPDELVISMIKYVDEKRKIDSTIGHKSQDSKYRSCKNAWLNWDTWIAGIMHNVMVSANKEFFNYDLTHFETQIQATFYDGATKDFYTWHVDGGNEQLKVENNSLLERKLSCSLLLSDPEEYDGGELQFHYYNNFFYSTKPKKGESIVFPAWVPHRVRPVRKGSRISLVAWMNGPCFK